MKALIRSFLKVLCAPIPNKELRRKIRHILEEKCHCVDTAAQQLYMNSAYKKVKGLIENADKIKIIALGDSHAQFGYLPFLHGDDAYNLAFNSNSLNESCLSLRYAHDLCKNLRAVVLVVSYYNRAFCLAKTRDLWRPLILEKLFPDIFNYALDKKSANFKLWNSVAKRLNPQEKFYCVQGYDFAGTYKVPYPQKKVDERVGHHFKLYQKYNNQLCVLEEICDFCAQNNLKLLVVDAPVRQDYQDCLDHLNSEKADLMKDIREVANAKKVVFIEPKGFEVDDFADSDHLNFEGALKFTQLINQSLAEF